MAANGYAEGETLESALGPPITLRSSTRMPDSQDGEVDCNFQATSSSSARPRLTSDDRGSSPLRPALVASLEAKRRSSSVASLPAARVSNMGPPSAHSNASSQSPAEGEVLRLQPVGPAMQERESVLSISIICDQGGTHVSLSESTSTSAAGISTRLLLSALEEAKDQILRAQWHDGQAISPVASPRNKRRASESASSPSEPAKRPRHSSILDENPDRTGTVMQEIPSSDKFLNHLLVSFAKQGYSSMTADQRESLMMSTLSSTYASFATKLHRAQRWIKDQQREAAQWLGQRDEAISRLRVAEHRLSRCLKQARSRATFGVQQPSDGPRSTNQPSTSSSVSNPLSSIPAASNDRCTPSPDGLLKITLQPVFREQESDPVSERSRATSEGNPSSELCSTSHSHRLPLVEYRDIQSTYEYHGAPGSSPSAYSQIACGLPQAYPHGFRCTPL